MQHTRAKLPEGLAPSEGDPHITPWHQDAGAFDVDADPHFGPHVWLPPSEARPENGCLQIVPHAHHEGLQEHRIERGLVTMGVDDERSREEGLTVPMDRGDVPWCPSSSTQGSGLERYTGSSGETSTGRRGN